MLFLWTHVAVVYKRIQSFSPDVAFAFFNMSHEEMVYARECHAFLTGTILDSSRLHLRDCVVDLVHHLWVKSKINCDLWISSAGASKVEITSLMLSKSMHRVSLCLCCRQVTSARTTLCRSFWPLLQSGPRNSWKSKGCCCSGSR